MENEITNRVENSNLIQVNLDDYYLEGERVIFDVKTWLKDDIILIEKEFRNFVNEHDWSIYKNKYVAVVCSADAIVPLWAFMLVASKIKPFGLKVVFGAKSALEQAIFRDVLSTFDFTQFQDKNVIVKGCGKFPIPESIFVDFSVKLQDYAKNIMFGEACSTVPLYKKPK